jgi:hypothetical protein
MGFGVYFRGVLMKIRNLKLAMAAALFGGITLTAQASLIPLTAKVEKEGDQYRYTYGVILTSDSIVQPGDSFALYDFSGYVPDSAKMPSGWSLKTQPTGGGSGRTLPNDDPNIQNLVWTYTGSENLYGQSYIGQFSALSTNPQGEGRMDFTSRTHIQDSTGQVIVEDNITTVIGPGASSNGGGTIDPPPVDPGPTPPGVPEPSTLLLLGAGLPIALGARYLRRRKESV